MTVYTVTGGKGGTGKTVVAVNLAAAMSSMTGERVLLVDVDVDNPCTYTLLQVEPTVVMEVKSFKPVIDDEACTRCGRCVEYCPAHALVLIPGSGLTFVETLCEGCAMCMYVCPEKAITRGGRTSGWVKEAETDSVHLILGELRPGDRKYHDVMEKTLEHAREVWNKYKIVVIDTPPGTGKGIRMALEASDVVVAVTEPTRLGILDLKRLDRLIRMVGRREVVVVNKYGLPGGAHGELEAYLRESGVRWFKIQYDRSLMEAYMSGRTVVSYDPEAPSSRDIRVLAEELLKESP